MQVTYAELRHKWSFWANQSFTHNPEIHLTILSFASKNKINAFYQAAK